MGNGQPLIQSHGIRAGLQLWPECVDWQELREGARIADRLGFATIWTWDHLYSHVARIESPNFEAWTLLGGLATVTERATLGVLVSAVTYRHPIVLAKAATTLDSMTGGRASLGLGAGWVAEEHARMGLPFGTAQERVARLEATVQSVSSVLHQPRSAGARDYPEGSPPQLLPAPVRGHLPIVIGGKSRQILSIVARFADGWNAYGTADALRPRVATLMEESSSISRPFAEIATSVCLPVVIRSRRSEAERYLAKVRRRFGLDRQALKDHVGEPIMGDVIEVAEAVARYQEIGFREVILMGWAPYDLETWERFLGDVMPMLNERT